MGNDDNEASSRLIGPYNRLAFNRGLENVHPQLHERPPRYVASDKPLGSDVAAQLQGKKVVFANETADAEARLYKTLYASHGTVTVYLMPLASASVNASAVRTKTLAMLDFEQRAERIDPSASLIFKVMVEAPRRDKRRYGAMDFPLYIVGATDSSYTALWRLMEEHGVPRIVYGIDIYDRVRTGWSVTKAYGISVPSEIRAGSYVRVGFVNEDQLLQHGIYNMEQAEANVVVHEMFHMAGGEGALEHAPTGLMTENPDSAYSAPIRFSPESRKTFFAHFESIRRSVTFRVYNAALKAARQLERRPGRS